MEHNFDVPSAKKFLLTRELSRKVANEKQRESILALVEAELKKMFLGTHVEVYLIGSITQPYAFHTKSDIDIVLKNFQGDKFDVWTKLESCFPRTVEVILFEQVHFQEHIIKNGRKVL